MKKVILKILIALSIVITAGIGVFFYLEEEIPFGTEAVKNSKLDIYCPLQFSEGEINIRNLSDFCPEVSKKSLSANLYGLEKIDGKVYGLLEKDLDGEVSFSIIGISEKEGIFIQRKLDEKPKNFTYEKNRFKIHPQEKEYEIGGNQFIKIINETKELTSSKYQFSIEIPINWEYEKRKNSYLFFHPEVGDYFIEIDIANQKVDFKIPDNISYGSQVKGIKESLKFTNFKNLPDYHSFREGKENYLKINTVKGDIVYYEDEEEYTFSVLASGDPEGWNGTPSGFYNLISKEGLRFSTESEVFMPFSMRLYGKYLIHGEAYFPSGFPYTSPVSGGCVRVRNQEMEKLYNLMESGLPIVSITHEKKPFEVQEIGLHLKPEISAESFLVVDINSGKILSGKNYEELRKIADLTKIMTAIIAVEQMGVTTPITARDYMLGKDDSNAGISSGRPFRLVDLLAPLLVESSDNAARVLSHYVGRDNTLDYMREKADSIGMKDTYFADSFGVDFSEATAKDLYYLLYYLTNTRKPILDITRGAWVPYINYNIFQGLKNKNIFYGDDNFVGGMFEINEKDLHNGAFLFNEKLNEEKRELAFIILGVPTEAHLVEDIKNLKNWIRITFN